MTHRSLSKNNANAGEDPEPNYEITLNSEYQDYVSYIFMGNRNENFSTYFNKYFSSLEDFDEAMKDYKTIVIANYNRRLDSLYTLPPLTINIKDKLNSVIAKCSKIIQYNKNSRFLDASVLLIGRSYYFLQDFYQSERKFDEFISKLSKSNLTDEVSLYLGKTKLRLKKEEEGFSILKVLIENSNNPDLKSEATQELALYFISQKNYQNGIDYIKKSIELTTNNESKAEKQFLLARLYTALYPQLTADEFLTVSKNSSDFDLNYYAKLNYAKALDVSGKYSDAFKILDELIYKYRDYPEIRQLAEIEIANNLHLQRKFKEALEKYFYIIVTYPNTVTSAEAYYRLAKHYEDVENNYLKAYIGYKKVNEQNPSNDYADFSSSRTNTFNKYFTLVATINDTTKGEIPAEIDELEKYKTKIDIEKGINKEKELEKNKGKDNPIFNPKGGGQKGFFPLKDSIENKNKNEEKIKNDIKNKLKDSIGNILKDSIGNSLKDSTGNNLKDSIKILNEKGTDSLKLIIEKLKQDSLQIIQQLKEDSLKNANIKIKEQNKFNAYLELSELFTYELNRSDSAQYYILKAIDYTQYSENKAKAYYFLATLYKNSNRLDDANTLFKKIIEISPNSVFANESRKLLGLKSVEIVKDDAEKLYKNVESKILTNQYRESIKILDSIISNYKTSIFYPKSLYTVGWVFENIYGNKDSMIFYYKKLNSEFPQSEYFPIIADKINFYTSIDSTHKKDTAIVNDSIKIVNDTSKVTLDSLNLKNNLLDNLINIDKNPNDYTIMKNEENIIREPIKKK
jgi:tetratricopeptide (TPR) repeat protein